MKVLTLILFISICNIANAKIYVFSGGKNTVGQFIASEILTKAYNRAGIQMKPLFIPLQESLNRSNAGLNDGEIARIQRITDYAPNLEIIPISVFSIEAVVFSKNKNIKIRSWSELKHHSLVIVKGSKFIEKGTEQIPRQLASTYEEALEWLDSGKFDVAVLPRLAALKIIYENKYDQISQISPALQKVDLFHFVHKKNVQLVPLITLELQKMNKSGEIAFARSAYLRRITRSLEK